MDDGVREVKLTEHGGDELGATPGTEFIVNLSSCEQCAACARAFPQAITSSKLHLPGPELSRDDGSVCPLYSLSQLAAITRTLTTRTRRHSTPSRHSSLFHALFLFLSLHDPLMTPALSRL